MMRNYLRFEMEESKPLIYGLNPLYRSHAKLFADKVREDGNLSKKVKALYLFGSVVKNKPNPSDIDIFIDAEDLSEIDTQKIMQIKSQVEVDLKTAIKSENPEAHNQRYSIPILVEINKYKLWEQVTKWNEPRIEL